MRKGEELSALAMKAFEYSSWAIFLTKNLNNNVSC